MLTEFRHRSWFSEEATAETLSFLEAHAMTHVIVDAPRIDAANVVPAVIATTSPTAYLRLHGRNGATWQVRGRSAAERFDHLYSRAELGEWVAPLAELAGTSDRVYAMFNNNGRSVDAAGVAIAQAPTNALVLRELLGEAGVAVTGPSAVPLPGLDLSAGS
jgi:uncharacterized protein YecE (DUF72 family)